MAAGTYTSAQSVIISTTTPSSTIYYTTNGATPTSSSSIYSGAISVSASETLKAIATASGYSSSAVGSAAYVINPPAATPTFSVAAGTYTTTQTVTIADTTPSSTIYYTTNGTTPTPSSSIYSGAISVSASETLKAIATASGYSSSAVGSAAYVINPPAATPTFSVAAGTYTTTQSVVIKDTTPSSTIYYTTNGATPTPSSSIYSSAIQVSSNETIKAIANASGYSNSAVGSAAYVITPPAATPTFSVAAGTYLNPQTVSIGDTTTGATIYYTTDGSTPSSTNGSVYSGPVSVGLSETLTAVAIATGYSYSTPAAGAYIITSTTPTPTPVLSQPGGAYNEDPSVLITDSASNAVIYYTKSSSGTTPTTASTRYYAGTAIAIPQPQTLEAIAIAPGYAQSAVATAAYTLYTSPTVTTPAAGTYSGPITVTITDASPNTKIYYTTNGGTPTFNPAVATLYSGPFTISATTTLKIIAGFPSATPSAIQTVTYTITP